MINFILDLNPGLLILGAILIFIGLVSQLAMYAKAGKPGLSALVPVWNVIVFVEIVGRPKWHSIWILLPGTIMIGTFAFYFPEIDGLFPVLESPKIGDPYWTDGPTIAAFWDHMTIPIAIFAASLVPMLVFIGIIFTEICDSFGKHSKKDKIYVIVFNAAYLLFQIGISDAAYEGPWYAKKNNLPYTMPDLKGTPKKKKSEIPEKYKKKKGKASKPKTSGKKPKKEQSEVLAAIAERYKKKK